MSSPTPQRPVRPHHQPLLHRPAHAPRVPFALLVVGLIVGGMGLLLVLNTASAANELRRHDIAARDAQIADNVQQLSNDVAASAAPANLADAAIALGMVPAGNPGFLRVGANGKVTVLGSPGQATAPPQVAPPSTPKPKPTAKPTPTRTPKSTGKATPTGKATASTSGSPTKPAPTKPTPTPTPTVSLPGGPR